MNEDVLWSRQVGETPRAYGWFSLYCGMTGRRSLRRLAAAYQKNVRYFFELSVRHEWQERVKAYDCFCAAREDSATQ
jgi:hypothetical protein